MPPCKSSPRWIFLSGGQTDWMQKADQQHGEHGAENALAPPGIGGEVPAEEDQQQQPKEESDFRIGFMTRGEWAGREGME